MNFYGFGLCGDYPYTLTREKFVSGYLFEVVVSLENIFKAPPSLHVTMNFVLHTRIGPDSCKGRWVWPVSFLHRYIYNFFSYQILAKPDLYLLMFLWENYNAIKTYK